MHLTFALFMAYTSDLYELEILHPCGSSSFSLPKRVPLRVVAMLSFSWQGFASKGEGVPFECSRRNLESLLRWHGR